MYIPEPEKAGLLPKDKGVSKLDAGTFEATSHASRNSKNRDLTHTMTTPDTFKQYTGGVIPEEEPPSERKRPGLQTNPF